MVVLVLCLQLFSLTAYAVGECSTNQMDIHNETDKIGKKLLKKYGINPIESSEKAGFNKYLDEKDKIDDEQEYKVDRSRAFLDQFNAVGIVTDAPLGKNIGYGTGVLISPCHVLTNAHAALNEESRKGITPIYVSLGQSSCESKNAFLHQDMPGKVIAIGNFMVMDNEEKYIRTGEDYAIIKIFKNIPNIKIPTVATEYMSLDDELMIVGFTHKYTYVQKTGLRYPTVTFTKINRTSVDGTFTHKDKASRPGGSGSGIFALDRDENSKAKVFLTGIHQGEDGRGIQTAEIVSRLTSDHPKVADEIIKAIQNNTCN